MSVGLELLFILLLILSNGVLAMAEIAIITARRARLLRQAEEGHPGARAALQLARNPNRFLSTVQVGITLVATLAGAFGGATLAAELAAALRLIPFLAPHSDTLSLGIVVLAIAYLSLVLGELVPKRLALGDPERFAMAIAPPMQALSRFARPVVRLLSASTEAVIRALGIRAAETLPVTDEEISLMIEQGRRAGVFAPAEQSMVDNVLRLDDRHISVLMTPRTQIVWLDLDDPPEENWRKMADSDHAYFPVYRARRDNVLGIASVRKLWAQMLAGHVPDLEASLLEPLFIPDNVPALAALELFRRAGSHVALVMDEFGGIAGLITPADFLAAIVGDIAQADEQDASPAVQQEDGAWLLSGMLPVDEFMAILDIKKWPEGEKGDYETLGGFVMARLGRIPAIADRFAWGGLSFEVNAMDGHRVDKVRVTPQEPAPPGED